MRLPATILAVAAILALSGCGDDEPEPIQTTPQRPTPQRPAPDTLGTDTVPADSAARPDRPGTDAREGGAHEGGAPDERAREVEAGRGPSAEAGQAGEAGGATAEGAAAEGRRLYTVQVASFMSSDSARKWTGRLQRLDLPVWTSAAEVGGQTYYRVRVGAVPTVTEARRLGGMLSQRFEWPVWIAPVTTSDRVPPEAVPMTQRLIGGD